MQFAPKRRAARSVLSVMTALVFATTGYQSITVTPVNAATIDRPGSLAAVGATPPLVFEPNQGQSDRQVKFLARGAGYAVFLTTTEAVLAINQERPKDGTAPPPDAGRGTPADVLRIGLVGANPDSRPTGENLLPGRSHYFEGSDPGSWRTNISHYAGVRYAGAYPGVDLVYSGSQNRLKYEFLVAPGGDPKAIRLNFEGAGGLSLDGHGNLVVQTTGRRVVQPAPAIYQQGGQTIPGRYVLKGPNQVGIETGAYDATKPLTITPVVYSQGGPITGPVSPITIPPTVGPAIPYYATYLGGSSYDAGYGIALDAARNAYVMGVTQSANFPLAGTPPPQWDDPGQVFVAKLSPDGKTLLYSAFLSGGSAAGGDKPGDIAVDLFGNAYITGNTYSNNFPVVPLANPVQAQRGGRSDVFVAKLNPAGDTLLYSTYLGGQDDDWGMGIAVDLFGNAYVTGGTASPDFPTTAGAFQATPAFDPSYASDAFVTKLNAAGTAKLYSTFLGAVAREAANDIAVDGDGNAHVTGYTSSITSASAPPLFPLVNPLEPHRLKAGDFRDAFVSKLNATGSALLYSTLLGGGATQAVINSGGGESTKGHAIALDPAGNAYVTGETTSPFFFPISANATQGLRSGGGDAFVTKLNATGGLIYSTFLGGSYFEAGRGIAVDSTGTASVVGWTTSPDFPAAGQAFQANYAGNTDAFVARLNAGGALIQRSYFGGSGEDTGASVAVSGGEVYLTGWTGSANLPANAYDTTYNNNVDAFVARIGQPITVINNAIQFSAASYSVVETGGSATITVTRSGFAFGTATVNYRTISGTATPGFDYQSVSGTLTFASGQQTATFTVPILLSQAAEGPETVGLVLSNVTGNATLGATDRAVLTITDVYLDIDIDPVRP